MRHLTPAHTVRCRFYGMTNLQIYIYYTSYPGDSKLHKFSVSLHLLRLVAGTHPDTGCFPLVSRILIYIEAGVKFAQIILQDSRYAPSWANAASHIPPCSVGVWEVASSDRYCLVCYVLSYRMKITTCYRSIKVCLVILDGHAPLRRSS